MGPALLYEDIPILARSGIGAVLAFDQLSPEIGKVLNSYDIDYFYIPIDDYGLPTLSDITRTVYIIDNVLNRGDKIYIHCLGGIGRSNLMLMIYFVVKGVSPRVAASKIAKHRNVVGYSPLQKKYLDALQEWHDNGRQGAFPTPTLSKPSLDGQYNMLFEEPYVEINPEYYKDAEEFDERIISKSNGER